MKEIRKMGRVDNAVRNVFFGIVGNILTLLLGFILRTVFIHALGVTYLGVNGLYTNVLSVLSLAELGIGTAMNYSLYKPAADNDYEKIKSLMQLYKHLYRVIAIIVAILGLILLPFLTHFIKDPGTISINKLYLFYLIFLFNTVSTYFVSYKTSLVNAHQKYYIQSNINVISLFIVLISQIIVLTIFHNYLFYILTAAILGLIQKIYSNRYYNRLYPYLLDKKMIELPKEDKDQIKKNAIALIYHKIGEISINQTDYIIISSFISIATVGLLTNYNLIITSIIGIVNIIFNSVRSGFGNLIATENKEKQYLLFKVYRFLAFWMYSFVIVALLILTTPFITLWIGKDMTIHYSVLLIIMIDYYFKGYRTVLDNFKSAAGIFEADKYISMLQGAVNLVVSILLVKLIGLEGVFIGTVLSGLIANFTKPFIIYKVIFNKKVETYYKDSIRYTFALSVVYGILIFIKNNILSEITIRSFIIMLFFVIIIPNLCFYLFFSRREEFQYLFSIIKSSYASKYIAKPDWFIKLMKECDKLVFKKLNNAYQHVKIKHYLKNKSRNINEENKEDLYDEINEEINKDIYAKMNKEIKEDIIENFNEDIYKEIYKETNENAKEEIIVDFNDIIYKEIYEKMNSKIKEDIKEEIIVDFNENIYKNFYKEMNSKIHKENIDVIYEDMKEEIIDEIHEDMNEKIIELIHEDIKEEIIEVIHEDIKEEIIEVIHEDIKEKIIEVINEDIKVEIIEVIHEDIKEEIIEVINEDINEELIEVINEDINEEIIEVINEDINEKLNVVIPDFRCQINREELQLTYKELQKNSRIQLSSILQGNNDQNRNTYISGIIYPRKCHIANRFSWSNGLLVMSLEYSFSQEKEIQDFYHLVEYYDAWIEDFTPICNLGHVMNGYSLIFLHQLTNENKYKLSIDKIINYLYLHSRDKNGSLPYYKNGKNDIYTDNIGMICPFLCRYGKIYHDQKATDLAINQIANFIKNGFDASTFLPYHGFNLDENIKIGIIGWGRAVGWLLIGMVDSLEYIDASNPQYAYLCETFNKIVKSTIQYQLSTGHYAWQLTVLDGPIDTSATSIISYAIKRGVMLGILNKSYSYHSDAGLFALQCSQKNGPKDIFPFLQGPKAALISIFLEEVDGSYYV